MLTEKIDGREEVQKERRKKKVQITFHFITIQVIEKE